MWVLKFEAEEEYNIYATRTKKYNVKIHFFSQRHYVKGNTIYLISSGNVLGEEKNKKLFFSDLKKDKQIHKIEINEDFFICIYKEKLEETRVLALKTVYNQKIIFLKPVIINEEGVEEWEIASFFRKDLENIINQASDYLNNNFKILYFKEKKVKNLMMQTIAPELSPQQEKVIFTAITEGYYGYPRSITLKKIAKMLFISESTCQFHLSKAEAKIMSLFSKNKK